MYIDSQNVFYDINDLAVEDIFTYSSTYNSFIIDTEGIETDLLLNDNSTKIIISDIQVQKVLLSNDIDQTKSDITSIELGCHEVYFIDGDMPDVKHICKYYGSNPLIHGERPAKIKLIAYNNSDLLDCIPKD